MIATNMCSNFGGFRCSPPPPPPPPPPPHELSLSMSTCKLCAYLDITMSEVFQISISKIPPFVSLLKIIFRHWLKSLQSANSPAFFLITSQ